MTRNIDPAVIPLFNQELPTQTACVRKDCVELINKVKPSVCVIVSVIHVSDGETMLFVNWPGYFKYLQNPRVQMPRIEKNGRQAENHPSLLEDGRGAKEEDEVSCPTFYAVRAGDDPDGVHECDCQPDDAMFHGLLLKVEKPSRMAILECITPELFSKGRLLARSAPVTL